MNFNSDPTKQAQEVIFSRKAKEIYHPPLVFNNTSVPRSSYQKVQKLQNLLPRSALITIYEVFVRPILHYGGTLYDQWLIIRLFTKN